MCGHVLKKGVGLELIFGSVLSETTGGLFLVRLSGMKMDFVDTLVEEPGMVH